MPQCAKAAESRRSRLMLLAGTLTTRATARSVSPT